jgi:hypothetical protein
LAGDWIKMRMDLWDHPKVVRIVSAICPQGVRDVSLKCRVIGALYRTWAIADTHSEDGILDGYDAESLNASIGIDGWAENMQHVGWLVVESQRLIVPRFTEHNGESAKKRAEDAKRKRLVRKTSAKRPQRVRKSADKKRTREEKRREDIDIPNGLSNSALSIGERDVIVPDSLNTPEVRAALAEWLAYKRKKRQAYTDPHHVELKLAEFEPFGPLALVQSVSASIGNNWAGLFTPKSDGRPPRVTPGNTHDPEAARKDPNYGKL